MRRRFMIAALLPVALFAVACSNSNAQTAGSSGKSTFTIELFGQLAAASYAYPEMAPVVKAEIAKVNAAGGVKGEKVNLVVCNDQGTQAGEQTVLSRPSPTDRWLLSRRLPSRSSRASAVPAGRNDDGREHCASQADYSFTASFPASASQAQVVPVVEKMIKEGCKKVAFIHWEVADRRIYSCAHQEACDRCPCRLPRCQRRGPQVPRTTVQSRQR